MRLILLCSLLLPLAAQTVIESRTFGSGAKLILPEGTYANRPGTPAAGNIYIITDAPSAGTCTAGGSTRALCRYTGSAWEALGGAGGSYTLPKATNSVLGGVKVGAGLAIDGNGMLSNTTSGSGSAGAGITVSNNVISVDPATVPTFLTGTGSLTMSTFGSSNCEEGTITVSGAATGDTVMLGVPSTIGAGLIAQARVTSTDTVTVRVCRMTGSATISSLTFRATILRSF